MQGQLSHAKALILIYELLKKITYYTNPILPQCFSKWSAFQTQGQVGYTGQDSVAGGSYFLLLFAGNLQVCTPERSSRALSVSSLGKQEKPGLLGIGTWKGDSPVVEQEEAGGQGDSELQPPPVRDGVGDGVEEQEPDGESRLVEDPHRPAVLRAHHLCHCQGARGQVSAMVPHTAETS